MVICISSSMKFEEEIKDQCRKLTSEGHIVLTPVIGIGGHELFGKGSPLMTFHKDKINLSDMILVLNVGGYIGDGVRKEIDYAITRNIPIEYLEPI